jgi:hypothetical protein
MLEMLQFAAVEGGADLKEALAQWTQHMDLLIAWCKQQRDQTVPSSVYWQDTERSELDITSADFFASLRGATQLPLVRGFGVIC